MKTFIKCLAEAATAKDMLIGDVLDNWTAREEEAIIEKAADLYAQQGNLHKHVVSSRFLADLNFIIENMGYDLVKDKVSPEAQKEYLKRLKMMRDELSENGC